MEELYPKLGKRWFRWQIKVMLFEHVCLNYIVFLSQDINFTYKLVLFAFLKNDGRNYVVGVFVMRIVSYRISLIYI